MLLQFNVKNHLSFKNEAILSLYANADKSHEDELLPFNKEKILPSIAIYGANAAGKSNLHKALTAAILLVRESSNLQVNQPLMRVKPFLLDDDSRNEKTRFDFIYTYKGTKYEYGFVLDKTSVYEEYLYEYKTSKPTMIFERSNINDYKFTTQTKNQLAQLTDKNTPNKLFLSTATAWNSDLTKNAYMWFAEAIDTYDSQTLDPMMYQELEKSRIENDNSLNEFMLKLLKRADINISNFNYEVVEHEGMSFPLTFPMDFKNGKPTGEKFKEQRIETIHKVNINGEEKEYILNYGMESNGTRRLFTYGPAIKNALEKGKTISIDEIDNMLHPALTKSIIEMFNDPTINKKGAQLIFNTHEISLLDLDLFRRDQIYFVEKNNSTGISDLYALDDFSPRKSENIQKGYLLGRYGAIPAINSGDLGW